MSPPTPAQDESHTRFSRRLQWLTLALGFVAAIGVAFRMSIRIGAGVAVGTVLAWLNYRWLDRGLGVLVVSATAQEGSPQPHVPMGVYVRFAGRYLLIGLLVYATVHFLHVPLLSVVAGLLALGAGAMTEGLYELIAGSP
jgi:ATP synthase I chain